MPSEDPTPPVLHNPDGSVFEGTVDPDTQDVVAHYTAPDGSVIENVVVPKLARPPA